MSLKSAANGIMKQILESQSYTVYDKSLIYKLDFNVYTASVHLSLN